MHKRLVSEESYQDKEWAAALKKAFLGTDEDIRAGGYIRASMHRYLVLIWVQIRIISMILRAVLPLRPWLLVIEESS